MDSQPKPRISVSAGIIRNEFHQIYLTERLEGKDFSQALEFPGGKVRDFDGELESYHQALVRELDEELGITVVNAKLYAKYSFEYPHKIIDFEFYLVDEWIGVPFGREGQEGFWLDQTNLDASLFPPANKYLIDKLLLEVDNFV